MRPHCAFLLPIAASVFTVACDRSPVQPTVDDLVIYEVILQGDDGSFTFSHTDHWHGAPAVREGEVAGFTVHFSSIRMSADEHDPPPVQFRFTLAEHPEYELRVVIEDTTIARWSGSRAHGTLHGLKDGASRMNFVVRRGPTTIYEAPPLNFRVQPPAGGVGFPP